MELDRRRERARSAVMSAWDLTGRAGIHEMVLVVTAFLLYFIVRGAVVDRADLAFENARRIIDFERSIWLYHELSWQSWALDHRWFVRTMNAVYFWGHMPLVIAAAIWLWARHRHEYVLTRNAFLVSGAIGIAVYWLVPVAPPRLLPDAGFVDTMAVYDRVSYNAQETAAFVNPYAALPSLHFGWAMLLGGAIAWVGRRPAHYAFGLGWPLIMAVAIVVTGNHFIVDAAAGAVVCLGGLAVSVALDRRWPHVFRRIPGRDGSEGGPLTAR